MFRGLYKAPERYTAVYWSKFPHIYLAGDVARKDDDGYFWVQGRADDVLNVSGHRIGNSEVESALVDGKISKQDRILLEDARRRLGLRTGEAQAIMHDVLRDARLSAPTCPHCGKPLIEERPPPRTKRRHHGKGLLGS